MHWSLRNRFTNKNKIPNLLPLFVNSKLVSDFHKKAELFNLYFAVQCILVQNKRTVPVFNFETTNRLKSFEINHNDLFLIIKNFIANKGCSESLSYEIELRNITSHFELLTQKFL